MFDNRGIEYRAEESSAGIQDGAEWPPSFRLPVEPGRRGVLVIDNYDRISRTDANIFRLLNIEPANLLGRSRDEVARTCLRGCFADPSAYLSSCEWLLDHPDEILEDVLELSGTEPRTIHRYSAPIFDENHQRLGRVEVYSDITKRRQLELQVELAYMDLKSAQDQLVQSEKLRAMGEIASGVAHDFNNTLGIILGNIQLLLRGTNDEAALKRLRAIERVALDASETVGRIQKFTRTDSDAPPAVLDLGATVSEVVEMMRPAWQDAAQASGVNIEVLIDPMQGVFASGDGPEVREVLANIVLNAIQAMPDGGDIHLSTGRSGSSSWIRIADTGIGMDEDVRKRVFDPFFTTRRAEGTGLGMSVAYGIVKRHGGSISIESEPAKGTVVTVFLPAADEPEAVEPSEEPREFARTKPARVLVVDDEPMFADVFAEMLAECGHDVSTARCGREAVERFSDGDFDLVFTDLGMPEMSGWQVASAVKEINPAAPVVLLTGWGASLDESELKQADVDMAMKLGAYDYITKPFDLDDVQMVAERAVERHRLIDENAYLREELRTRFGFDNVIGLSPEVQKAYLLAARVADSSASVLILGETGTGKEYLARAIHYQSPRASGPFVKVSCAALPESLLESELFGHEKGSFTGAIARRLGRFELADGGTLFLDEIGDTTPATQIKLLRVLQEKQFERVGGSETLAVDVRIIAATNRNLKDAIAEKQFREDLFYRLNVVTINLPPLRERREDVPELARHFIRKYCSETGKTIEHVSPEAGGMLRRYDWQGNIRELENCIERAVIFCQGRTILPQHLLLTDGATQLPASLSVTDLEPPPNGGDGFVPKPLQEVEKEHIRGMLAHCDGNQTKAAGLLQIDRKTLRNKIRDYGLGTEIAVSDPEHEP